MPKQKKKPKPRGVWKINPKTRVEKSKKTYSRAGERKKAREIVKRIDWFGSS